MNKKIQKLEDKIMKITEKERLLSQKFINRELRNFVNRFSEFQVRYEHEEDDYFVEINPGEIFFQSDELIKIGISIMDNLEKKFPTQSLCFISENDVFSLERTDFKIYGKEYARKHKLVYSEDTKDFNYNRFKGLERIWDIFKERKHRHETV